MGRKTDVLLKGFRAAKCLTLLKVATARIKVVRNKRSMSAKQMRGEIAQLIKSGQDAPVYITKADALIKQENMVAVYNLLDQYCHAVMSRFPAIEMQRNCPPDMKEAIASIIYAAPRCIELTELPAIKEAFIAKYGKEFGAAASELRPDCGVNTQIIELLSTRPATGDMKLKLMKEICTEHNVDWTPGEALAGPAVALGRTEAKVEPLQATGTLGSIKANAGVGEAGPSKSAPPQGALKHGASNKVGLAEATVTGKAGGEVLFATSDQKQSSASQGDAAKGKSNVSEHLKGTLAEASSKAAAVTPDASKADSSSLSSFEEEDARRLHARILQSLKGGSFSDLEGEAETPAEVSVKLVDAQDGMSDSDSDSFVSVEEGRFEDDLELSLDKAASRKESFRESPNPGLAEADLHQPSLGKRLSDSSQKYTYSRAEADLQQPSLSKKFSDSSQKYTYSTAEADLQQPSLSKKLSDSSQKDSDTRASSENSGAAMEMHEGMPASSLASKSSHKDMFLRASSKKSLNAEQVMEKESRKGSFNMGKLVEEHSVEGLKEDWIINEHEDIYARVSSKKSSSNAEEVTEKVSRKDSLNKGNLFETHSVVKLNEDMRMNEMVAEPLSVETSHKEGLLRKDSLKGESAKATPESSFTLQLPKKHTYEATKIADEPSDEGFLQGEGDGMIKVTPSVSTPGNDLEGERVLDSSLDSNEVESVGEEKPKLPSFRDQSGPEGVFHQEMFSAAGEEPCLSNEESPRHVRENVVSGEKCSSSFENGGVSSIYPAVGISGEELVGASSLSALDSLENTQDFATAAKAIAAEAARLAVLDYAKRMAESGSIPLDPYELSKLVGVAFEQNKGRPQVNKISTSVGMGESVDSEGLGYAGGSKNHDTDLIREEERLKEGTTLNNDKIHLSGHINVDETTMNIQKLKPPVADDAIDGDFGGNRNASITAEENPGLQEMVTGIEDINPFATSIDKDTAALSSNIDDEKVSWVAMAQPGQTSNVGNYERDDDHLDIFFRRKTPWMSEERPMFDEDRYSFLKPKPSFTEEKMPYGASDKAKSSFQEDLFSKALFDTVPEGQSTAFKESSDSFKSPVFDEGEGVSFKIPVFDEGPEPYDATFSSDDGLDKSDFSPKVSDKRKPQFTPIIKSPASFDSEPEPEPEPYFEKIANEDELPIKERTESPSQGQLKWQLKKPIASIESVVAGDGVSGKPMSRRSRRQPKIYDDSEYGGDGSSQLTSRSSLLQQQGNEPIKKDEDNGREKKSWGSNPVRPYVSSSSALGQRPSDPPTSIPSSRLTTSPTRPVDRQRPRTNDYYFPEENDLVSSSAGTSRVRKTTKSPARMTNKQPMTHSYDDENDSEGYKLSYNIPSIPSIYQQDMVEDDHIEELQGRYKPSSQTSHLNKGTSAGSRIAESRKQQRFQQEEYREDVGESPRTRQTSSRPQQKMYIKEEPYLVSRYRPKFRDDEPLDYERSKNSRIPQLYKLEINEDEDNQQQALLQEEPGIGSNYKQYREESPRTRPVPNRRQHKYIEEEEPHLVSRYKQPVIQDDEPLNYGSNNKSRPPKSYQLEVDGDNQRHHHWQQEEPGMGLNYKQYGENGGERLRTRPMSSRRQEVIEDEESNLVSRYKQAVIQDDVPLNYGSGTLSRTPKVYQTKNHAGEDDQDLRARYRLHTQMDDPERRASASSGADRRHQHHQQEDDALESGYVHYEEVPVKGERTPSGSSASQKLSDFEDEPYLMSGYKGSKQLDNQVKSSPSRPPSSRQQEKKRIEEMEDFEEEPYLVSVYKVSKQLDNQRNNSPSRPLSCRQQEKKHIEQVESPPRDNIPIATDDDLLHCQEEEEEEEEHTEGPQQKQQWPMLSDHYEVVSQSKRENSGSQRPEQIQKDEQQALSGRCRKQSMAGEVHRGGEKQHLPLSSYKNDQEESYSFAEPHELQQAKQRHKSTPLPEGQQEQVGQLSKSSLSPSCSRKQDSRLEEYMLNSGQQELEHPDGGIPSGDERQRPQEEGVNEQQQKKKIEDAGVEEEKKNGQQDKLGTKSQLLTQQLPQSTSSPLEASISDPIVLATIPPPVKKPVTPSASTVGILESSASAPSPSKPPEVRVPKPPLKPPNLDDLAANFEAFRRARKGE